MNDLPGYRVVKVLGTVYGLTVRSRNWGVDIGAILKSVVGGEIGLFTRLMYNARNEAVERLVGEAMGRGGNAVVALRFVWSLDFLLFALLGKDGSVARQREACYGGRMGEWLL
jgi:uncharacterized protein YbjQ (UPF0145 family)